MLSAIKGAGVAYLGIQRGGAVQSTTTKSSELCTPNYSCEGWGIDVSRAYDVYQRDCLLPPVERQDYREGYAKNCLSISDFDWNEIQRGSLTDPDKLELALSVLDREGMGNSDFTAMIETQLISIELGALQQVRSSLSGKKLKSSISPLIDRLETVNTYLSESPEDTFTTFERLGERSIQVGYSIPLSGNLYELFQHGLDADDIKKLQEDIVLEGILSYMESPEAKQDYIQKLTDVLSWIPVSLRRKLDSLGEGSQINFDGWFHPDRHHRDTYRNTWVEKMFNDVVITYKSEVTQSAITLHDAIGSAVTNMLKNLKYLVGFPNKKVTSKFVKFINRRMEL